MDQAQAAPQIFTSKQMLALSTVFAVATWWAITHMLRDALQFATLDVGPLGSFPCDEGWVPPAAALGVGLLPQLFVFVRTWMKTGKRPNPMQELKELVLETRAEVKSLKEYGAGASQAPVAPPTAAAPAPASFPAAPLAHEVAAPAPVAEPVAVAAVHVAPAGVHA
jgi:hypothetical protein